MSRSHSSRGVLVVRMSAMKLLLLLVLCGHLVAASGVVTLSSKVNFDAEESATKVDSGSEESREATTRAPYGDKTAPKTEKLRDTEVPLLVLREDGMPLLVVRKDKAKKQRVRFYKGKDVAPSSTTTTTTVRPQQSDTVPVVKGSYSNIKPDFLVPIPKQKTFGALVGLWPKRPGVIEHIEGLHPPRQQLSDCNPSYTGQCSPQQDDDDGNYPYVGDTRPTQRPGGQNGCWPTGEGGSWGGNQGGNWRPPQGQNPWGQGQDQGNYGPPKPVYGPPQQGWGSGSGGQGWGTTQSPYWQNQNNGWNNQQGSNQGWGSQGGYRPQSFNQQNPQEWGSQGYRPQSNSQGPNQGWGSQGGYRPQNNNQQGPNQGWGSQGVYRPQSNNQQGPNEGWGSQGGYRPVSNAQLGSNRVGRWVPCPPAEVPGQGRQRPSPDSDCPPTAVKFELPAATPATLVDDKTLFPVPNQTSETLDLSRAQARSL